MVLYCCLTKVIVYKSLKYGFCNNHFGKMNLWPVEQLKIRFSSNQKIGEWESNFMINMLKKVFKKCSKSVQLVRVSSFRNDLLQKPYFQKTIENKVWYKLNAAMLLSNLFRFFQWQFMISTHSTIPENCSSLFSVFYARKSWAFPSIVHLSASITWLISSYKLHFRPTSWNTEVQKIGSRMLYLGHWLPWP